ncbi:uncharacterized protein SAMN05421676_11564 [Salinibacillus kushneri]|uniref:DUF418 domain-containing protein n=1 Tax=Salinibacillus kushneri TaxID=237682 RepID=A0A1I0J252_9BACI|nr:DUF418 domain-containing protein [Salinibacillus kushneri]SEU03783.1 uncharacterized protein SAMN05421676_11564 [Salinibacillus kushneri]
MPHSTPTERSKRIPWIDAARGFALFGILMVNVPAFHAPFFLYGGEEQYWNTSMDHAIQTMIDIFFQASFYTLFSLLFGFGMQMMSDRLQNDGVLVRRLFILLGFGVIHAFMIWHGDILLSYGAIGFLLFFYFRQEPQTLLKWFLALLIVPGILYTWFLYVSRRYLGWINKDGISIAFSHYSSHSLPDILVQNYHDWVYSNSGMGVVFSVIVLLPMFLFGMFLMKKRWLHDIDTYQSVLKRIFYLSLAVFILFKMGPYFIGNPEWLSFIQDHVGGAASSIFYLVGITLLFQHEKWGRRLHFLTYVGKMSLTNYISQSIICFLLFYGPGFGLYGKVSPVWSIGIVVILYSFQVFFSKWWLIRFYFGPLEWVWRSLTYKKKQPLKRVEEVTS